MINVWLTKEHHRESRDMETITEQEYLQAVSEPVTKTTDDNKTSADDDGDPFFGMSQHIVFLFHFRL